MNYGHGVNYSLDERGVLTPSPYITSFNDSAKLSDAALIEFQKATGCCSKGLPSQPTIGEIWVCETCTNVWAVPDLGQWALTRLRPTPRAERIILAQKAYSQFLKALIAVALSAIVTFMALVFVLGLHVKGGSNVYISFGIIVIAFSFSALMISRWSKAKNKYALTVPDDTL